MFFITRQISVFLHLCVFGFCGLRIIQVRHFQKITELLQKFIDKNPEK